MEKLELRTIDAIHAKGDTRDRVALLTAAELPGQCQTRGARWTDHDNSWFGGIGPTRAREYAATGHLAGVEQAEQMITKLEHIIPQSMGWQNFDTVAGAIPIVPAYISGSPMSMRARKRTRKESAPLAIMVDLTTSSGITPTDITARGATILALVRMLSNLRPVELWAGCGLDGGSRRNAAFAFVRIDTAPLDIARAAFILTSAAVSRGALYGVLNREFSAAGAWPYNNVELYRKHGHEIATRFIPTGSELLFVPPLWIKDETITAPVKWLTEKLTQYGGETMDDAA